MSQIDAKPTCGPQEAVESFHAAYNLLPSSIKELPGERDLNFRIQLSDGREFVFKIGNPTEPREYLDVQTCALQRLSMLPYIPRPLPTVEGKLLAELRIRGQPYIARAIEFKPGIPLAEVREPSMCLLDDLGHKLGRLDQALEGFDHPVLHRAFDWNLRQGLDVIQRTMGELADRKVREWLERAVLRISRTLDNHAGGLRYGVIHNDANDHNIIIGQERDADGERGICGIIDFGDLAWSYIVAEVAIAAAYVACLRSDPMRAITELVAGYHRANPLSDDELACLYDLTLLRLCVSICMHAVQGQQRPDDAYLSISQESIHRTLPRMLDVNELLALAYLRHACNLDPNPRAAGVANWLRDRKLHPVMGVALQPDNCEILDLGVESSACRFDDGGMLATVIPESGRYFIGRYAEPRLIYTSSLFSAAREVGVPETRTIHLGIDVFAPVSTPVFTPLEGEVVVSEYRDQDQDYGGLLILRHTMDDGQAFFSLYGHLSRDSVQARGVGAALAAGDMVGRLGDGDENGGWPSHLHIQLITDLVGRNGDFPGVALSSERGIWTAISLNPVELLAVDGRLRPACRADCATTAQELRRKHLGTSLRLSYRRPLHLARGRGQYLFDVEGRRFLDAYNNVPHVGHCHPRVVQAACRQMELINTNTRYLHDVVQVYARRLAATLPAPLEVCFFLNSASEANELAIRLARAATGRSGIVVQEAAYHGHTTTLIDVSPYKHQGRGGQGAPDWVHTVNLPDSYRGRHRGAASGIRYGREAVAAIHAAHAGPFSPAAFLAETCPSVGGQIIPPEGYLALVYEGIRAVGGLAIADEVQTGFGRLGDHFWAFEAHQVVPDIVVMGKPMGNGHPLAAVVTTPSVAAHFDNGMEFFSTFGGNSVSCAVGLAVLDVLEDEQLQRHAVTIGEQLREGFLQLSAKHPIIGDVRGSGLFWGLELVRDRETLEPAGREANLVVNRLRERGILIGSDGIFHQVLKIRPPMPFTAFDADLLLDALDYVLAVEFGG